ncbi:hypothetical protein ACFY12_25705 [Streptomyces sp. NPDC001339]|uniref:hypothetical protein n=1 Tax=Streptomyces sp. NPDC001339 TaxID=3364563 RepID=UPI0036B0433A
MTILRRHLSTGFTVVPTAALEDARLSFRARGVLAFLISKPDAWKVRAESLASAGKEGKEAIKTALRELKDCGYYRVVTERMADGRLTRITEVYDTAQEWAAEEYRDQEARRVARRAKKQLEGAGTAEGLERSEAELMGDEVRGEGTESRFSGGGFPDAGSPDAGSSGVLVSNQSQYPENNPPTPTAGAAGEFGAALIEEAEAPSCPRHPEGPGRSCRGCGTSPRQMRERQERAEKARFKAREREANERLLAEVRRKPGVEGLSEVALQQLARMREVRRSAAAQGKEVESPPEIG